MRRPPRDLHLGDWVVGVAMVAALAPASGCRSRQAREDATAAPGLRSASDPATDAGDSAERRSLALGRCAIEMERRILAANPLVSRDPAAVRDVRATASETCAAWSAMDDGTLADALAECASSVAYEPWAACIFDAMGTGAAASAAGALAGDEAAFSRETEIRVVCERVSRRRIACLRESGDLPAGGEPPEELVRRLLDSCETSVIDRRVARKLAKALDACADAPCGEHGAGFTACVTARMLKD